MHRIKKTLHTSSKALVFPFSQGCPTPQYSHYCDFQHHKIFLPFLKFYVSRTILSVLFHSIFCLWVLDFVVCSCSLSYFISVVFHCMNIVCFTIYVNSGLFTIWSVMNNGALKILVHVFVYRRPWVSIRYIHTSEIVRSKDICVLSFSR